MPIYEYHCEKCGKDSELLIRSSNDKPQCPECGSKKLSKKFSVFASSGKSSGGHVHTGPGCACHASGGGCHGAN